MELGFWWIALSFSDIKHFLKDYWLEGHFWVF
jgi:hypothetical protein